MKRVLIVYSSATAGHQKAASAIGNLLQEMTIEYRILNLLTYLHPRISKISDALYLSIIRFFPWLWALVYDRRGIISWGTPFLHFINQRDMPKLKKLMDEVNPDLVFCTHAYSCKVMTTAKAYFNFKLIGIITDFDVHGFWIHPQVDQYVVTTDYAKKKLMTNGISESRIAVLGIPINPKFSKEVDKDALVKKFGLDPKLPTILVMGGKFGVGPIFETIEALDNLRFNIQVIVIVGANKSLKTALEKKKAYFPLKVFGEIDYVNELMKVSDILMSKSGGLTCAESLACGLPMIIIRPVGGQEERNARYLTEMGGALQASTVKDACTIINDLLKDPEKLVNLKKRALSIGYPYAVFDIINIAMKTSG